MVYFRKILQFSLKIWKQTSKNVIIIPIFAGFVTSGVYLSSSILTDSTTNKKKPLTFKEKKFRTFASVELNGEVYMTPQDFLESIIKDHPRPRMKRKIYTPDQLEKILKSTPSISTIRFFRNVGDNGIISFTEYLFLHSVLTKPRSGFRIAFQMFDTDGNHRIDKDEFLVMKTVLGSRKITDDQQPTTLLIHFFGPKGKASLYYPDFVGFMENLQVEVLEMEFTEFSHGLPSISEVDFAQILLRFTILNPNEYDTYINRLLGRMKESKGIYFEDFYVFFQFLNNLEDFNVAVKLYALANHPITKTEFHRAVKIFTGTTVSEHLVDTVFAIFDEKGNGLSYKEFNGIMKQRLHRGFRSYPLNRGWTAFRQCIKEETK